MNNNYPTDQDANIMMNQLFAQKNTVSPQYYYGYNGGMPNPVGYNDPNSRINAGTYPANPYSSPYQQPQQQVNPPQAPLYNPYQQNQQYIPQIQPQRPMPTLNMTAIDSQPAPTFSNPFPQYMPQYSNPIQQPIPQQAVQQMQTFANPYNGNSPYPKKPDAWFSSLTPVRQDVPNIDWNTPVQGMLQNPYQVQPQYAPSFQIPNLVGNPSQFQTNWVDTWNANKQMSY